MQCKKNSKIFSFLVGLLVRKQLHTARKRKAWHRHSSRAFTPPHREIVPHATWGVLFYTTKDTLVSERTGLFAIVRISSHALDPRSSWAIRIYFATSSMIHFQQHPQHVRAWPAIPKRTEGRKQICMSPLIELALEVPVLTDPGQLLLHCSKGLVQYPQYFGSHPAHLQRFQRFLKAASSSKNSPPAPWVICNDHVSDPWWSEKRT